MTRIILDNKIKNSDLIEFDLFTVKNEEMLRTDILVKDLEASDQLINFILQQYYWKAFKSLDFKTKDVTIGYGETETKFLESEGLTESDAYDIWIGKFKEKERRFKRKLADFQITKLSQSRYDALLGLFVITGTISTVGSDIRKFNISEYISTESWEWIGTALVMSGDKRIFCQSLAKILMLADYGKYKDRSLFKEQGIQTIRKEYSNLKDDTAKKQAELIYYKETSRFLPKMSQTRMRQIVKMTQ